jgi:hypothetical protein
MYATIIFLIFLGIGAVFAVLTFVSIWLLDMLADAEDWVGIVFIVAIIAIGFLICLLIDFVL